MGSLGDHCRCGSETLSRETGLGGFIVDAAAATSQGGRGRWGYFRGTVLPAPPPLHRRRRHTAALPPSGTWGGLPESLFPAGEDFRVSFSIDVNPFSRQEYQIKTKKIRKQNLYLFILVYHYCSIGGRRRAGSYRVQMPKKISKKWKFFEEKLIKTLKIKDNKKIPPKNLKFPEKILFFEFFDSAPIVYIRMFPLCFSGTICWANRFVLSGTGRVVGSTDDG